MRPVLDETHDLKALSWVESANAADTDFPIQNLPFASFRSRPTGLESRVGIAIGDCVLDLSGLKQERIFQDENETRAANLSLGSLGMLMGNNSHRQVLRCRVFALLREDASASEREAVARHLVPQRDAEMLLPASVGDYTDFYASIYHATNVGRLFRPDNPLLPNYKYVPIGYHGRASSLVVSGTRVRRPWGQTRVGESDPTFAPTKSLDYELEVGFFVSAGNSLGDRVPISSAGDHIFGICLLNDWSARDIQAWEYQPLGPFLGKSFATTLSPWVVTMEALAPFRTAAFLRPEGDPQALPYLFDEADQQSGGLDVHLEVSLQSARMREAGMPPAVLSRSNARDLYWTLAQMLAHHTSNGCNLRPGDLLATGTVSGEAKSARGCLLELTSRGQEPVTLPSGEQRKFLEDGDEVILRGWCEREGFRRIGLGTCRGIVLGAS